MFCKWGNTFEKLLFPIFFLMIFPAKSWTIYVASETQSCTVWDAMTKWGHQSVVLVGKYTWNASHLQVNFQFEYNSPATGDYQELLFHDNGILPY